MQTKITWLVVLLLIFSSGGYAQNTPLQKNTLPTPLFSPVSVSIANKPLQLMRLHFNPPYKPFLLRRGGELMHWPNYPLTAAQIIARQNDWQRRNSQTVGEQIASDIIKSNVNKLIYGHKAPPAVIPKF